MTEPLLMFSATLLFGILILLLLALSRINRLIKINSDASYQEFTRLLQNSETGLNNGFSESRKELREVSAENRREIQDVFKNLQDTLLKRISENSSIQIQQLNSFKAAFNRQELNNGLKSFEGKFSEGINNFNETVSEEQRAADARKDAIEKLLDKVEQAAQKDPQFSGIHVNRDRQVIDFGDRARFDTASHQLNKDQSRLLRAFIPHVLDIANSDLGKDWLKRIVVEGFADKRGSYLLNLNLSMQRSQRMLCVLLAKPDAGETELSSQQHEDIRQLFLVGGYSSNSQKDTLEESRRIELRLEFRGIKEPARTSPPISEENFGTCAL